MQKKIILLFFLMTCLGVIYSQNIKIIYPNGGENLKMGDPIIIKWSASGTTNPFKITLWKNRTLVGKVKEVTAGNGTRTTDWVVGSLEGGRPVMPGPGFKIKIKEKLKNVGDLSDNPFGIRSKNTTVSTLPGKLTLPDLVIDRFDSCIRTERGGLWLRIWVKNIGDRDATDYGDKFLVKAALTDKRGRCANMAVDWVSNAGVGNLKKGQSLPFDFSFNTTAAAVCIYLDSDGTLAEKDENNNFGKFWLTDCRKQ